MDFFLDQVNKSDFTSNVEGLGICDVYLQNGRSCCYGRSWHFRKPQVPGQPAQSDPPSFPVCGGRSRKGGRIEREIGDLAEREEWISKKTGKYKEKIYQKFLHWYMTKHNFVNFVKQIYF